jgi:mRNA-degrading endonuclease HigB of HigAB toxin-antitoxin module
MIKIACQINKNKLVPFSQEDLDELKKYKQNQVVDVTVKGTRKARSYPQLQTLHCALRTVAENAKDANWNTPEKAKQSLKVELQYIDLNRSVVDKNGNFHPYYRSFGYDDLDHMEACNLFDRSWPVLAAVINITVEELLENAKTE